MVIERTGGNSLTISLAAGTDVFIVQRLIDYARYLEATSTTKARQADVDSLADEINHSWWQRNKSRFL